MASRCYAETKGKSRKTKGGRQPAFCLLSFVFRRSTKLYNITTTLQKEREYRGYREYGESLYFLYLSIPFSTFCTFLYLSLLSVPFEDNGKQTTDNSLAVAGLWFLK